LEILKLRISCSAVLWDVWQRYLVIYYRLVGGML